MKKIYVLGLLAIAGAMNAQNNLVKVEKADMDVSAFKNRYTMVMKQENEKTSAVMVQDTLWYTLNKHGYRNQSYGGFYTVKSPYPNATLQLNHFGAKFINNAPVTITGLEMAAQRQASSPSASVPVRIYLCNVNSMTGGAQFPAIDSVQTVLTGTAIQFVGGNFSQPKTVTGDFAVVYRNISTVTGDTIRAWMNNAGTSSFTVPARQYGEGIGLMSLQFGPQPPTHTITTNLFGTNWDNEFLVAPRVTVNLTVSAAHAPTASCTQTVLFSSNPSSHFTNKFFNMFAFETAWGPFTGTLGSPVPNGQFMYNWSVGGTTPTSTLQNTTTSYNSNGTFPVNLTCKYIKMNDSGIMAVDSYSGAVSVTNCPTGIMNFSSLADVVVVYPNPVTHQLNIKSDIENVNYSIVNMLGEKVKDGVFEKGINQVNLTHFSSGVYFIRLQSSNKESVIKFIKE
jgi:hypothetical protein